MYCVYTVGGVAIPLMESDDWKEALIDSVRVKSAWLKCLSSKYQNSSKNLSFHPLESLLFYQ